MNENQHEGEEEAEDDAVSSPLPSSPLFGRLGGAFTPARQTWPQGDDHDKSEATRSYVMQSFLVGSLSIVVVTMIAFSLLALISLDSFGDDRRPTWRQTPTEKSDPNLLGLYRVSPSQLRLASSLPPLELASRPRPEEEAYFLRYYVIPLEHVKVVDHASNFSGTDTDTDNDKVSSTRLMRPHYRLLQTARALTHELGITAKEDVLQPLVERWTGRTEFVRRALQGRHVGQEETQEAPVQQSFARKIPLLPSTHGGVSLHSILGFHPSDLLAKRTDPALPKDPPKRQPPAFYRLKVPPEVCPISLFCYYTIPPTVKRDGAVCPNYCRRCLETLAELKRAVQDYLRDPSHTSQVARTYGWPIGNWCVSYLRDFSSLFANTEFNEDISNWDLSSATSLQSMFQNATLFNQALQFWDTSKVIDMSFVFAGASNFNQPLNHWSTSRVTTLQAAFLGATRFNQDLTHWNVGKVQDLSRVFEGATKFSGDVSTWTTTSAKTMRGMFQNAVRFNGDISTSWSFRGVTDMSFMFSGAVSFLPDSLNAWDVSSVSSMKGLFLGANKFNANVSSFNTTQVKDFSRLFEGCSKFNQDLSTWDVGSATDMRFMFAGCSAFDGSLAHWQVSRVKDMTGMFLGAASFQQNLTDWKPYVVGRNCENMFEGARKFERRYKDAIYAAWAQHTSLYSSMFGEHKSG